jgi:hypothetical protein
MSFRDDPQGRTRNPCTPALADRRKPVCIGSRFAGCTALRNDCFRHAFCTHAQYLCQLRPEAERACVYGLTKSCLAFSVPPGYRRGRPPARPKLDPFTEIIDAILAVDEARPKKQRHTAKRIFDRLRDEHGYAGGITIVKDYVQGHRQVGRERAWSGVACRVDGRDDDGSRPNLRRLSIPC